MTTPIVGRQPGAPIHVAIVVPCMDRVHSLFAFDLAQMMTFTASVMPENCGISLHFNIGTYIHRSRQELMEDVLRMDPRPTHILWLDGDMRFPQDAFIRLLQRNVPFVGINYSSRRMPPTYVGIKKVPLGEGEYPGEGVALVTNDESEGLEETDALGFGFVLMEAAALANLPDPDYIPWFSFEYKKDRDGKIHNIGEDVYFWYRMVKEHLGQRLFCDHDLSKQCSHIGDFEHKFYHPAVTQEALAEEEAMVAAIEGAEA